MALFNWKLSGITVEELALAVVAALISYLVISSAIRFLVKRLEIIATKTTNKFDDIVIGILTHTSRLSIFLISLLVAFSLLDLPPKWELRLQQGWIVAIGLQLALWLNSGISIWMQSYIDRATTTTVVFLMRMVVWLTLLLTILANIGINITAFVTSLGIGGIAVALALQNILSDLFASVSIALDKPFEIGDFIVVGDMLGTVEYIGVKTTRIRSLSGEQIVTSNTELLKNTIHNFKRMTERRAVFDFSVAYQTSASQAATLPELVKNIIGNIPNTRFDRAHFKKIGDSALEYEVVYYVLNSDYNEYMDIQQRINLELMQACEKNGISFAYPTRTLHIVSDNKPALSDADMPTEKSIGGR
jgi:small-conductance mechanosensitive channel